MTDNAHRELRAAAELAQTFLARVGGEDGIIQQLAEGKRGHEIGDAQARDLTALLDVMRERVRFTRAQIGAPGSVQHERLGELPLNRKERYYTGTVLPMIVGSDGFAHLGRFLALCGLQDVEFQPGLDGDQSLQLLTEYGFAESVFTNEDKAAWPGPIPADTPDVVVAGPDWLLAVEAKMFHNPNRDALQEQMHRQAAVVDMWRSQLRLTDDRVRHVLLLPERLADRVGPVAHPVVTWESVLAEYEVVGPRYWTRVLRAALESHEKLESQRELTFGANAADRLTGTAIVEAHATGEASFDAVGRSGGLGGPKFQDDVASGRWRTVTYEVRSGGPANRNWFTLAEFIAATTE